MAFTAEMMNCSWYVASAQIWTRSFPGVQIPKWEPCMQILECLCPDLDHTTTRNTTTDGSHALLRPDATYGQPPIVFFEEKAESGALKQAERELHQKFAAIPQYCRLKFVIGVAIAGDKASFQAIGLPSMNRVVQKFKLSLALDTGRAT